ncbi:MAG TPA: hypothetical protein PLY73_06820, partial [Candidatus Ozemobacteraceae bacterium]|nr:hypothetical protein [Candidatus Ozemobacteraceae bacterium]
AGQLALVGVQQVSPLAAPLARSLVLRCQGLDDGEFRALSIAVENSGSQAGMKLLREASALRQAETLQK